MSSKIRVLDEHTINKIAAGEVIENPASVVKELVENSIDAGSSEITIEIVGGGRQMIRISDNGCGMNADDALLCLERHATSKIRSVEEIFDVDTMGFRGEAIPSIASISKFMLLTATSEATGTLVLVEGGKVLKCASAVRSVGTTIEVKSLFYNIPVRMKFQKSPSYDANEILKVVSLLALGNPTISFKFINNGKIALQASQKQLKERVGEILGDDFMKGCFSIEDTKEGITVKGLVGYPGYTRQNRTGQYLFINHRAVQSLPVSFAVKDGYGTSLATGRYPIYVLYLDLPGNLVDVNVHPQKREVRLRHELVVKELISKAVAKALSKREAPKAVQLPSQPFLPIQSSLEQDWVFQPKPRIELDSRPAESHIELRPRVPEPKPLLPMAEKPPIPKALATLPRYIILDEATLGAEVRQRMAYSSKGGICLLDHKAAHTRILFESLQKKSIAHSVQTLLIPYTIELPPADANILRSHLEELNGFGIHLREFGSNTFLIDAIPQVFGNADLQVLISDFSKEDNGLHMEKEKRLALSAARASVAYDSRLSLFEGQALINQLMECQQPYHCPQGKSIFCFISPEDLAKQFQKC